MRLKSIILAIVGIALTLSPVYAATYKVDDAHTTVGFKVRHLFSNVQGNFKKFEGMEEVLGRSSLVVLVDENS